MRRIGPSPGVRPTRKGGVTTNPFRVWDANKPIMGGGGDLSTLLESVLGTHTQKDKGPRTISEVPWTYSPQSSWVYAYRYFAPAQLLQIAFKNRKGRITAGCQYAGIHYQLGYSIYRSVSKGKWVWRNVYYWRYTRIF